MRSFSFLIIVLLELGFCSAVHGLGVPGVAAFFLAQASNQVPGEDALRVRLQADPADADAGRALAARLEKTGRGNAALAIRRAILLHAVGQEAIAQAQLELATSLVEAARPSEAVPLLQKLLLRQPGNEPAIFELGTAFARMEDFKSAARAFTTAVDLKPSDDEAQLSAAKALVTLLRYSEAERYLNATSDRADEPAEVHRLRGVIDSHTSRNDEAIREFKVAIALDPTNAETQQLLGESLLEERRNQEAIESLKQAAGLRPSVAVYFQLVKAYHAVEDKDDEQKAIQSLRALQEEQAVDTKVAVLRNEAEHAITERHFADGRRAYESALILRPEDGDLEYRLALVRGQMGDRQAERDLLAKALERSPTMAGALSELGTLEGMNGETASAGGHLRRAIQIDPQRTDALTNLAVLLAKDGDLAQAESMLKDAIESDPSYASAYRSLGLVYAAEGRSREAENELRQSVTLDGHDPANELSLGQLYLSEGRLDAASAAFLAAIALAPSDAASHTLLAKAMSGLGNFEGALEEAQKALTLASAPSSDLLTTIKEACSREGVRASRKTLCTNGGVERR